MTSQAIVTPNLFDSVANDLSDLYVYIYITSNSNSVLVPDNMSICTKIAFLSQLLTRQSTQGAQNFLAKTDLAQGPLKKHLSSIAIQVQELASFIDHTNPDKDTEIDFLCMYDFLCYGVLKILLIWIRQPFHSLLIQYKSCSSVLEQHPPEYKHFVSLMVSFH